VWFENQLTNIATVAMNPIHWVPHHSICCRSTTCCTRQTM